MSKLDPQPGEQFDHESFARGCRLHVVRRGERRGWGEAVWVDVYPTDGHSISKPRRIWSLKTWRNYIAPCIADLTEGGES